MTRAVCVVAIVLLYVATLNGIALVATHYGPTAAIFAAGVQLPLVAVAAKRLLTRGA